MNYLEIVSLLKEKGVDEVFWYLRSGFSKEELNLLKKKLEMELLEWKNYDGIEF